MKNIITITLMLALNAAEAGDNQQQWTPIVDFSLEGGSYIETLHWVSGWSYAITEIGKENAKSNNKASVCLPQQGYIGSRELLEILNEKYKGKQITSEAASVTLLAGVKSRYACND